MELKKTENTQVAKYDPKEIVKKATTAANFKHLKTMQLAICEKSETLSQIKKNVGEKVSLTIIKVWIINLNDFLNISRKMNPAQIDETAELIYDDFYYLKISDLAFVFKRIKTGYYGNFYESIDGMKIIDMFHQYSEDRIKYHIKKTESEHKNHKRLM